MADEGRQHSLDVWRGLWNKSSERKRAKLRTEIARRTFARCACDVDWYEKGGHDWRGVTFFRSAAARPPCRQCFRERRGLNDGI